MSKKITEIVTFSICEGYSKEEFIEIVDQLEKEFHFKQPGYIDSELAKGKDNCWTIIMHWKTIQDARNASKNLMSSEVTKEFRELIIPSSVIMRYLDNIRNYSFFY